MKTIETNLRITEDNTISLTLPQDERLPSGIYHVLVVIDENPVQTAELSPKKPLKLKSFPWKGFPADCTFRREDIYESDGR